MRFGRILVEGKPEYCIVENNKVRVVTGNIFGSWQTSSRTMDLQHAEFLSPVNPSKIVAVGLNYRDHAQEMNEELPEEPLIFLKPPSVVIGPGEPIILPRGAGRVDYEAELAIVIGKMGKRIPLEDARHYILGYTCLNDVTARELQSRDGQWTRAKSFDTFCPLGPWIATEFRPDSQKIELFLNGELKQQSNTNQLIFNAYQLVSHISSIMTLLPGDVIATGTPSGVGPLAAGDIVEVSIEGLGILDNPVRG
ncbi:MAG: fumarylacetoacetate hydrolase family protein [Firmicutes bacterium]|nr:fumarylacetoacetate hydrolase family protein [Bacillota bacterium]